MVSKCRASVVLVIGLALLLTGLAPGAVAQESPEMGAPPWDTPGSAWTGTITTTIQRTSFTDFGSFRHHSADTEEATYTEIRALSEAADGDYTARVAGEGGTVEQTDSCGSWGKSKESEWSVDADYSQLDRQDVLRITTDDSGNTTIIPWLVYLEDSTRTSYNCNGSIFSQDTGVNRSALGFQSGESASLGTPAPVPDTDPDPLRLVGSRTWTLVDPPYALYSSTTGYSFTMDYDLTLVPPAGECRTFTAAFTGKLDELEMFRYALEDLLYCQDGVRATIRSSGTPRSDPTFPAGFAGALDVLGIAFRYDGSGAVRVAEYPAGAEAVVRGKYSYCMGLPLNVLKKGLTTVVDRLPKVVQRKLRNWLDEGARFFVRKLFSRVVPDWVPKAVLSKGISRVVDNLPLSRRNRDALLSLVEFGKDEFRGGFEDYMVSLVTDGVCIPKVWTPEITVNVPNVGAPVAVETGARGLFTAEPYGG